MIVSNQRPPRVIYLCLMFVMLIVGCDSDSSGAKETLQLDNDEDPTAIERPRRVEPLLLENTNKIDDKGEYVVIQDFDEKDWQKIRQDFNLGSVEDSRMTTINSKNIGADEWKPWDMYQYRIIYFSEGGSLKAKPLLRNKVNEEMEFSSQMLDSLKIEGLWSEIQRSSSNISKNYN